jgi:hypothetical protein
MVTAKRKSIPRIESSAPNTQTELRHLNRSISYSDGALSVEWLNTTQGTNAYKRVIMVRQELEQLGRMLKGLREQEQAREQRQRQFIQKSLEAIPENFLSVGDVKDLKAIVEAHSKPIEQFRERHNAFNRMIARYTLVPLMEYSRDYGIWKFNAAPKVLRGPKITINGMRVDESTVIAALCRLAARHELYRVRLCEMCRERWRVSEREMDKFCSRKCREAFYAGSSEFRAKKARNQRDFRAREKERHTRGIAYLVPPKKEK